LLGLLTIENGSLALKARPHDHPFEFECAYRHSDPYALALSLNIHRRHLTSEQKRELIAKLLRVRSEASNNSIAKQVKADDKTVAAVRRELESNSEIPNKPRKEAGGRSARGRKPGQPATKPKKGALAAEAVETDDQPATNPIASAWAAASDAQRDEFTTLVAAGLGSRRLAKALDALLDPARAVTAELVAKAIDFLPPDVFAAGFAQAKRLQAAIDKAAAAKQIATGVFAQTQLLRNGAAMSPESIQRAADRAEERSAQNGGRS
jgi:hypothetical protein